MTEIDPVTAAALNVIEADVGLFLLEEMARHDTYRLNIAMLALPALVDTIISDCGDAVKAAGIIQQILSSRLG